MNDLIVDQHLLDRVTALAQAAPRQRQNHNFHASDAAHCHRLVNAIEPGSYIAPHCHADAGKDESIIVLRGALGVVCFDRSGDITHSVVLRPGGDAVAVNIPHGVFHTVAALQSATVFFEAKAGPYLPLATGERAPWAPAEGDPRAPEFLERIKRLLGAAR
ncbi:MAG: WbuC family cupin fold metalloprotein [Planctomycetota bacterium]